MKGNVIDMYDMKPYLDRIEAAIAQGPYRDDWDSLAAWRVPQWYQDAKFGIFVHWGVYSVPAFGNEWYPRNMYLEGTPEFQHHVETWGRHKDFGYKDFIPLFKAEKFDPEAWADLFAESGARYVVPVAEHHDGFQMYRSEISHWNAAEMGPKRDVVGELSRSFAARGLTLGVSTHRIEHWWFMGGGRAFDSDVKEPLQRGDLYWPAAEYQNDNLHNLFSEPVPTKEFLDDWLVRTCELIDRFQPRILYFDWWIQHSAARPYLKKIAAYYYNRAAELGYEAAINYKHEAYMFGTAIPDIERGQFADMKPYFWQTDTAVARNSWGYTENNVFKPAAGLIRDLVDIVSKNGALLLNVGPKPDGTISDEDAAILREIGAWLKVNGAAIYGAKVWRKFGEGPTQVQEGQFTDGAEKTFTPEDIRYTENGGSLYATALVWPDDGRVTFKSLAQADATVLPVFDGIVRDVTILGAKEKPQWSRDETGLHVCAPGVRSDKPVVIRVEVE